ncbi:MAG: hypothetical protein MRY21_05290 [Simkaniaceae bacterium]|nr:hypothetical protein [Simkaniaceae bacterium]
MTLVKMSELNKEIEIEEKSEEIISTLLILEKSEAPWSKNKSVTKKFFRNIAILKESAHELEFQDVEKLCDALETQLSPLQKENYTLDDEGYETLFAVIDGLNQMHVSGSEEKETLSHLKQQIQTLSPVKSSL